MAREIVWAVSSAETRICLHAFVQSGSYLSNPDTIASLHHLLEVPVNDIHSAGNFRGPKALGPIKFLRRDFIGTTLQCSGGVEYSELHQNIVLTALDNRHLRLRAWFAFHDLLLV